MRLTHLITLSLISLVAACASAEKRAENRAEYIEKYLTDPADRKGIELFYPLKRSMQVIYYPDEISFDQMIQQMSSHCARFSGEGTLELPRLDKDNGMEEIDVPGRPKRQGRSVWLSCDKES
ncbi:MAG: hypothetical protein ACPGGK_02125 [Pikeienuella sp.]